MNILTKTIPMTSITVSGLIWAVVIAVAGYIVIKIFERIFRESLGKMGVPELVAGVLTKLITAILYVVLILAVAAALGFNTGSIIIGLSAIFALILGFGLQDTMNNLAAGVWIVVSRAFSKGDVITVSGYTGAVEEVGILTTVLKQPDNTVITIPNRSVWGSAIVNYTKMPTRRITVDVGVAYGTDLDKAVKIALDTVKQVEGVLDTPDPQVVVAELADSSVNLQIRAWARKDDFFTVKEAIIKAVYAKYNEEEIEIPFPQLDVHVRDMPESQA
ncbi:MAG: mechanosensitive ion channel family protein [Desulfurococcales archaeon]|nr:mechanosensitive ion channel family protein [Desulfurococcales archaeon]